MTMRRTLLLINHDDSEDDGISADRLAQELMDFEGVDNVDIFSSERDEDEPPLCGCGARHAVHTDEETG